MPRPTTKKELLELSQYNYQKLMGFVNGLSKEEQEKEFPKGTMNRNIRDVLTHLHYWHLLLLEWYEVGMTGEKPVMPAKGYTWKTLPAFNKKVLEESQNTSLEKAKELLENSFQKVIAIIHKHSSSELFEKKRYKWTGSTSIGAYLVSNSSSHYDWGFKLIRKAINQNK